MSDISRKKDKLKSLFEIMDIRSLNKINAHELLFFSEAVVSGEPKKFLDHIVLNHCFQKKDEIYKDEFFYFVDCFFRGASKLLIKPNEDPKKGYEWRLTAEEIQSLTDSIFTSSYLDKDSFVKHIEKSNHRVAKLILSIKKMLEKYVSAFETKQSPLM